MDPVANAIKSKAAQASKQPGALDYTVGTTFKVLGAKDQINGAKQNSEAVVSSALNAVKNNQYHQKLSAEKEEDTEKAEKKDRHWTRYVPAAAGAMLLAATVPSIVKSGDVTKPLQDFRDGVKRVPAMLLNKAQKKNPAVKEARKGAAKAVKAAGGKAKNINNSPMANFSAGLFKGVGELTPFLIGSAYLTHKAEKAKKERDAEEETKLKKAYDRTHPIASAGKAVGEAAYKVAQYKKNAGLESGEYEKTAISAQTLDNYAKKRTEQFYANAKKNTNIYNNDTWKYIHRLQREAEKRPELKDGLEDRIKGLKLDMKANRYKEFNRAREASFGVKGKVNEHKKRLGEIARKAEEKAKEAARDKAYETFGGKVKYNVGAAKDKAKDYLKKNKRALMTATGIMTAGATIGTLHRKLVKPKVNSFVKDKVKSHYDKKIDKLYQQPKENEQAEKKASAFDGYFDGAGNAVVLKAAELPMEVAWTAGSEILKQRKRFKREKEKAEQRKLNGYQPRKDDRYDRRNHGNNHGSRKGNKGSQHNIQSQGR